MALLYKAAAERLRHNEGQWAVYNAQESCVVLAGPGSGKTYTLAVKVARMINEDVITPQGIACITFSNEAARELLKRFRSLGMSRAPNLFVGTVHSFCLTQILWPFGQISGIPALKAIRSVKVASPHLQEQYFTIALDRFDAPGGNTYIWRQRLHAFRRNNVDQDQRERDPETGTLADLYADLLHRGGYIDFDDIAISSCELLSSRPWVARALRAKFPIVVVDEYQDLGLALHRMVVALYEAGTRLLVVGDPDQSIYGFNGARPELLTNLTSRPGMKSIHLKLNYRSGQRIVDAAEVALGETRGYRSQTLYDSTVNLVCRPEGLQAQAHHFVDTVLPNYIVDGRRLGDIAILYLDKYDGQEVANELDRSRLPYARFDGGLPYNRSSRVIRWLQDCAVWCAADSLTTDYPQMGDLIDWWNSFQGVPSEDAQLQSSSRLTRLLQRYRSSGERSFSEWFEDFFTLMSQAIAQRGELAPELEDLETLRTGIQSFGPISVEEFARLGGHPDRINLITLHSAKGLEFDVVALVGLEQGRIPKQGAAEREVAESRRLFYVGLTRARRAAYLYWSGWFERQHRVHRFGPSEFVLEVDERLGVD